MLKVLCDNGESLELPGAIARHSSFVLKLLLASKSERRLFVSKSDIALAAVLKHIHEAGERLYSEEEPRMRLRDVCTLNLAIRAVEHFELLPCTYQMQCWFVRTLYEQFTGFPLPHSFFKSPEELEDSAFFCISGITDLHSLPLSDKSKEQVERYMLVLHGAPHYLMRALVQTPYFAKVQTAITVYMDLKLGEKYVTSQAPTVAETMLHQFFVFAYYHCLFTRNDCTLLGLRKMCTRNIYLNNGEQVTVQEPVVVAHYDPGVDTLADPLGMTGSSGEERKRLVRSSYYRFAKKAYDNASVLPATRENVKEVKIWLVWRSNFSFDIIGKHLTVGLWGL